MNLSSIKNKIKQGINSSADKLLSAKVKDELGLNKPTIDSLHHLSQNADLETDLGTFFKPVNSTFLSSKDYKNIQRWVVAIIVLMSLVLVFLFISMILPNKNYSNALSDSQIIVNGNDIKKEEKIVEEKALEDLAEEDASSEDLEVEDIVIKKPSAEKLAKSSPLLKSNSVTLIEYTIKYGDTLETIAQRYYSNSSPEYIQKIKTANNIRNARLIQVGQKLIIPM